MSDAPELGPELSPVTLAGSIRLMDPMKDSGAVHAATSARQSSGHKFGDRVVV